MMQDADGQCGGGRKVKVTKDDAKAHAQAWHFSSRSCTRLAVRMGSWVPKTLSEALPDAKCSFPVCPGICCIMHPVIRNALGL